MTLLPRFRASASALLLGPLWLISCADAAVMTEPNTTEANMPDTFVEYLPAVGPVQTGWIRDRSGDPMMVEFLTWNGMAVWEGDIVLGPAGSIARTKEELAPTATRLSPQGLVTDGPLWGEGTVPYVISGSLPNQYRVTDAIAQIEAQAPWIDFVPRTSESNYVSIEPTSVGCYAMYLGNSGGVNTIYLKSTCSTGNAMHELGHALGLGHEQSRCDRDDHVEIHEGNILPGYESQFSKRCTGYTDVFSYDAGSMMHYRPDAFAYAGTVTISSLEGLDHLMGQRDSLSVTDVATLNDIYPLPTQISGPYILTGESREFQWTATIDGIPPYYTRWEVNYADEFGVYDPANWQIVYGTPSQLSLYVSNCDGNFLLRLYAEDDIEHKGWAPEWFIENYLTGPTCW